MRIPVPNPGRRTVTWLGTVAGGGTEYIAIGRDRNRIARFRADCAFGGPIMERLTMIFTDCLRFPSLDRVSRPRPTGAADDAIRRRVGIRI